MRGEGMTTMDRRAFLRHGALAAGGGLATSFALQGMAARSAHAAAGRPVKARQAIPGEGYGPLAPVADQRGMEILALPAGFTYVTFGHIGSTMSDGHPTPLALDGMSAFAGPNGMVRLIRNHEDRNPPGNGSVPTVRRSYDPTAGGGTSTLDYDPRTRTLVRDYVSLSGSTTNCAGGRGYRLRSWISGEEVVGGPNYTTNLNQRYGRRHGYCFEVPLQREPGRHHRSEPIPEMGRFCHEAVAVDQSTGIVYLTEDPGSGLGAGFYRFIPDDPRRLRAGGRLQMLGVRSRPQADLRKGQTVGDALSVTWFDIDDPDPEYVVLDDPRSTFNQGFDQGGAKFNRLEGCWYDEGSVYFVSTSGGDAENGDVNADGYREGFGQVWEYRPSARNGGRLTLWFESPAGDVLDSPDNVTVTPRGGLLLCEDDASSAYDDAHPAAPGLSQVNRLIGLTPDGDAFEFAVNRFSESELAGVCFSPDGQTMFFNIFGASEGTPAEHAGQGMTVAVTGPWQDGPL
jgi:secreted PhoX family phosphatase